MCLCGLATRELVSSNPRNRLTSHQNRAAINKNVHVRSMRAEYRVRSTAVAIALRRHAVTDPATKLGA